MKHKPNPQKADTGNIGALEGYGPRLANTDGRSIVESCLIDR
jgi:hypothetical protein